MTRTIALLMPRAFAACESRETAAELWPLRLVGSPGVPLLWLPGSDRPAREDRIGGNAASPVPAELGHIPRTGFGIVGHQSWLGFLRTSASLGVGGGVRTLASPW